VLSGLFYLVLSAAPAHFYAGINAVKRLFHEPPIASKQQKYRKHKT
jgi:hypothetical protein